MAEDYIDGEAHALALVDEGARPLVTPQQARQSMDEYLALCEAVLDASDYQEFTQNKKVDGRWVKVTTKFKKKSAVKKLQTFFGVEVEIKSAVRDDLGDGHFAFRVIATARSRGGRAVEATGACSTFEERFDLTPFGDEEDGKFAARQRKALARAYHDVLSTAETRATNRAVMNAIGVGGGEVTADEVSRDRSGGSGAPQARPASQKPPEPAKAQLAAQDDEQTPISAKDGQQLGLLAGKLPGAEVEHVVKEATKGMPGGPFRDLSELTNRLQAKRVYNALKKAIEAFDEIPF